MPISTDTVRLSTSASRRRVERTRGALRKAMSLGHARRYLRRRWPVTCHGPGVKSSMRLTTRRSRWPPRGSRSHGRRTRRRTPVITSISIETKNDAIPNVRIASGSVTKSEQRLEQRVEHPEHGRGGQQGSRVGGVHVGKQPGHDREHQRVREPRDQEANEQRWRSRVAIGMGGIHTPRMVTATGTHARHGLRHPAAAPGHQLRSPGEIGGG